MNKKRITLLLLLTLLFTACNNVSDDPATGGDTDTMQTDDNHGDDHGDDDDHHAHGDEGHDRIDNPNGAAIRITSPTNGESFALTESIQVEVTVENFTLDEDGSHWHVYVDGTSFGMIVGQRENTILNGIQPGERVIEVYLANGDHEEFREGDSVMIVVE